MNCAVCCTPILFILSEDEDGELIIDVKEMMNNFFVLKSHVVAR